MTTKNEPCVTQAHRAEAQRIWDAGHDKIAGQAEDASWMAQQAHIATLAEYLAQAEAAAKAEIEALREALDVAWAEAHKMRNASKLVGPYPNDRAATRIWARSLYHAGKDLCAKLKPYRALLARQAEGAENAQR